jgi:hypothetical protein
VTIRQRGLLYALGGGVLTTVAFTLLRAGFNAFGVIGGVLVFAPPAMVTVGIAMMLAPGGETGNDLELSDWLDSLPLRRRILFYASGAVGLGLGALLLLILGNWSIAGVVDILL